LRRRGSGLVASVRRIWVGWTTLQMMQLSASTPMSARVYEFTSAW